LARGLSDLIRGGGIAEVGANAWAVYLVLRDHVWRSTDSGRREIRVAASRGDLAAMMRRRKICEMTGMSEATVKRALGSLARVGWVVPEARPGSLTVYVLGRSNGGGESYFAERTGVTRDPGQERTGVTRDPGQERTGVTRDPGTQVTRDPGVGSPVTRAFRTSNKEQATLEQATQERPLRKTKKRTDAVPTEDDRGDPTPRPPPRRAWADMPDEEDPVPAAPVEEGGRRVHPDEARRLASAKAKAARGAKGEYSSVEVVAVWRAEYFAAFGGEDTDLETIAQQQRAARTVATRVRRWCAGDVTRLLAYLGAMIRLWRDKKPDARFPSSATPRLATLLKQGRDGRSTFWRDWEMRRR
jgi:hypothetical protein